MYTVVKSQMSGLSTIFPVMLSSKPLTENKVFVLVETKKSQPMSLKSLVYITANSLCKDHVIGQVKG